MIHNIEHFITFKNKRIFLNYHRSDLWKFISLGKICKIFRMNTSLAVIYISFPLHLNFSRYWRFTCVRTPSALVIFIFYSACKIVWEALAVWGLLLGFSKKYSKSSTQLAVCNCKPFHNNNDNEWIIATMTNFSVQFRYYETWLYNNKLQQIWSVKRFPGENSAFAA